MNNFYTVTIYDKGAEIIRMIHTLIGESRFKKALNDYLHKYDGQAVTIEDFLCCFEESAGVDLSQFRRWYTQAGTPHVKASWTYDEENKNLVLKLSQQTNPTRDQQVKEPFYMPIRMSFLDKEGHDVHPAELSSDGYIILNENEQEYRFTLDRDTLPVILRDFSAPVKLDAPYTMEQLQHMLSFCDDAFIKVDCATTMQNRYIHDNLEIAAAQSVLKEPAELIASYKAILDSVDSQSDLILINETLKIQSIANLMETFDKINIDAIKYAHDALETKVAVSLVNEFVELYGKIRASSANYSVADMGRRAINNSALHMIAVAKCAMDKKKEASDIVLNHYNSSKNMTDKLQAMTDAVHLDLECKTEILKSFEKDWSKDALVFDNFFRVQATVPNKSAIDNVKKLLSHPSYDGRNPNRVRALAGALALSNPVALNDISGEGYDLLCKQISALNDINPSVAARILTPLLSFRRLDEKRQGMILNNLNSLMQMPKLSRSIYEKVSTALKE